MSRTPQERAQLAQYLFLAPWCQNQDVLVAACGQGEGVYALARQNAHWIDALDSDASHIRHARQHFAHPSVAYHARSEQDAQLNRTYQRVLCLNLLEKTEQPDLLLRNLHQHTADNGVLVVSVNRQADQSLDFQAVRNLLVPYFPYLYLFYINQHLAVSIADQADTPPAPLWLSAERQLDVNACEAVLILAGKQRFDTAKLPPTLAVDACDYLADLQQRADLAEQTLQHMQTQQQPLQQQLADAQQNYLSLKAELLQARDNVMTSHQRLITQQQLVRRYRRFERSPLMKVSQQGRGIWLRLRREWRHGVPFQIEKPQLPQQLSMPWQKKRASQPRLVQTLSWQNAPIEQLLLNELDWLKQQAMRKQSLTAGFNKLLVIGDSLRWLTWKEAFDLHGIPVGVLPASCLDKPDLPDLLTPWLDADALILHRLPYSETLQGVINTFRNRYTPVLYDSDELTTQPAALLDDDRLTALPLLERERLLNDAERHRLTRDVADYAMAPDQPLAMALKTEAVAAYSVPTPISYAQRVLTDTFKNPERYWDVAKRLWLQLPTQPTPKDMQVLTAVLVKLLLRYPVMQVSVQGADGNSWLPTELTPFASRLTFIGPLTVLERMRQLAQHDLQLLPLNPLNPSRQHADMTPWIYGAALAGVPTVASPTPSLSLAIMDGSTGNLAHTPEEWLTHLTHLIEQPNVRESMAQQAREAAIKAAYVENQLPKVVATVEQLLAHYQRHKHPDAGLTPTVRQGLNVAVALTWQPDLPLDVLCRVRALLERGLYLTVYLHTSLPLVDARTQLEGLLGPANGRYHCARLREAQNPHDLCLALDWQAVEAAQPVQNRFGLCVRWIDHLETDLVPHGLTHIRISQTYRSHWLHMTPHPWVKQQLVHGFGTAVQCLSPWVPQVTAHATLNSQRVLVVPDIQPDMFDWQMTHLASLQRQCPQWTFHLLTHASPKTIAFDHNQQALPQSLDELAAWLVTGDVMWLCSTGAPPAIAFWAMAHGLPVADVVIPGRESRYEPECPVLQVPMDAYGDQLPHLLSSHHYRLQLAEQSLAYTTENTLPLDSQITQILAAARQHSLGV